MTRDEILALKPGRELDALVAGKVMGYTTHGQFREKNGVRVMIDRYSADIAAAWEVLEEMQKNEWDFTLKNHKRLVHKRQYEAIFGTPYSAFAPTAPEAICKAALLAVMGE